MTLSIRYSDNIEILANDLADKLFSRRRRNNDPFRAIRVIVPNQNLAKWLKLHLAQTRGLCAGLQFPFIEGALWDLTLPLLNNGGARGTILTADALQQAIAATLICRNTGALAPLRDYCRLGENVEQSMESLAEPDCARRLWQLSGRLAAYFREYEFQRGDMIDHWLSDSDASWHSSKKGGGRKLSVAKARMEAAQRELYRALFADNGVLAQGGERALSLRRLAKTAFTAQRTHAGAAGAELEQVHFFGLSSISPLYAELLHHLSGHYDLVIYHFNVCMEYWEDIQSPWERVRAARKRDGSDGDEELDLAIENELLNSWGLAGRETLKLLAELEDRGTSVTSDEAGAGPTHRPQTVLGKVQQSIRMRTSKIERCPQDGSLQIVACPSIQREVEMVHNAILASLLTAKGMRDAGKGLPVLAHNKADLKLTDIAVLVPDMALYKPAVEAVFDARRQIPYSLVDSNASRESVYGNALLAMLHLAESAFTRREVFELLFNPCVLECAGATRDDAETWLEWADRLGVFHSFDREHRRRQGLPDDSRYSWNQALARIRLGRLVDDPNLNVEVGPPYSDINTPSRGADLFSVLVERLYRRLSGLANGRFSCAEWKLKIEALMADFLAIPADHAPEAYVRSKLHSALDTFADAGARGFGAALEQLCAKQAAQAPLAAVRQYLADTMASIPCGKGRYLTDGVTIAALHPMRPVPFKQVYVLGLGEGMFPCAAEKSTLDLRTIRRRVGDSNRLDAGRYLFLETLLSARERIVLSYVCSDLQKDEKKFPGSLIKQLKRFVEDHILQRTQDGNDAAAEKNAGFREIQLPLDEADERCVTGAPGNGGFDAGIVQTLSVYPRLIYRIRRWGKPTGTQNDPWQDLLDRYPAPGQAAGGPGRALLQTTMDRRIRDLLATCPAAPEGAANPAQPSIEDVQPGAAAKTTVRLRDLAEFLQDPALAILQRRLKLFDYDPEETPELAENEPLSSTFPHDHQLIIKSLKAFVQGKGDQNRGEEQFESLYQEAMRRSLAPDGIFAGLDKDVLLEKIKARMTDNAVVSLLEQRDQARCVVIGDARAYDQENAEHAVCAIAGAAGYQCVELSGALDYLLAAGDGYPATALAITNAKRPVRNEMSPGRHFFGPFLAMLALRASGQLRRLIPADAGLEVAVSYSDGLDRYTFNDISEKMAETYLKNLVADYLNPQSITQLLPYVLLNSVKAIMVDNQGDKSGMALVETRRWDDSLANRIRAELENEIDEELSDDSSEHKRYRRDGLLALVFDQLVVPKDAAAIVWRRFALPWLAPGRGDEPAGRQPPGDGGTGTSVGNGENAAAPGGEKGGRRRRPRKTPGCGQ